MSLSTTINPANVSYRITISQSYSTSEKVTRYLQCLRCAQTCSIRAFCRNREIGKETNNSSNPLLEVLKVGPAPQVQPSSPTKEQEVIRCLSVAVAINSLNTPTHFIS